ncbi:MAG: peptidase [Actinomycetia bacterium]|nr:peptidase [Actinomycetes bacterium]MCP5035528.1 peptidase [Actinomycetes bacterium]
MGQTAANRNGNGNGNSGAAKRATHRWARWLHTYTSMIALLIVLFFGLTGITLNHPDWTFGDATSRTTTSGTLTVDPTFDDGTVDWLSIAEEIRADYEVKGSVSDFGLNDTEGTITFVNPGYSADLFFDTASASFDLTVEQQGFVAVMNDLHKGRDTGSAWGWVIDISAGFLVAISATGLTMQFLIRKRRRSALISAVAGAMVSLILIWITIS